VVDEVIYIDSEKLKAIHKQVDLLFKENGMTVGEAVSICESLKAEWIVTAALDLVGEVYGIPRVKK